MPSPTCAHGLGEIPYGQLEKEDKDRAFSQMDERSTWVQVKKSIVGENQDGGVGRHTVPPRTTRTDRKSNGKEVRHQGNKK